MLRIRLKSTFHEKQFFFFLKREKNRLTGCHVVFSGCKNERVKRSITIIVERLNVTRNEKTG